MATQTPQQIESSDYVEVIGGSDFSGILANVGIYPFEMFVSASIPAVDDKGLMIKPGEKLPIKIPSTEKLYARVSEDFPTTIQLA